LGVLIATIFGVTVLYRSLPWVKEKAAQDARIAELAAKVDEAEILCKRLTRESRLLATDSEYAGIIARDKLKLMRTGETIFQIDAKPPGR
jgi:cell division protein FtsB